MGYLVLARKYRPQTFEDVVKQDHVTTTLQNAIVGDRVAHAVLFSGPRGTGKTTVARILAKAMNCEQGPTPTPCNACRSCEEITASSAVDVYEIDGASNNGVEQVRELRENIKYMPAHSRYKIYIIDEVHMLSTAAFNALLKTLEEPPAHVMFIFATTEPHKIPLTILSRCRRHDFRRIDVGSIADHLENLCRKEGMQLERESLEIISREAGGCMRDALSLLDQVMTCAGEGLSRERVLDILGVIDRKTLFEITTAILAGDIPSILALLDEVYDRGQDMNKLYGDLLEHFRNLMVVKLGGDPEKLVDVPTHELSQMSRQTENVPGTHISQLFDALFREEPSIRYSAQPKMALEMALVRMCQLKPALSVDELIERLGQIKDALDSGTAINVVSEIRTAPANPSAMKAVPIAPATEPPAAAAESVDVAQTRMPAEATPDETTPGEPAPDETQAVADEREVPPEEVPQAARPVAEALREEAPGAGPETVAQQGAQEAPALREFDFGQDWDAAWNRLVNKIAEKNGLLGAMLSKSRLVEIDGSRMVVEAGDSGFQYKKVAQSVEAIQMACVELFGGAPEIVVNANENQSTDFRDRIDRENRLKEEALSHPLVDEALRIFNGEVVQINIAKENISKEEDR